MNSRNWYIAKMVGLRLLLVFAVASWVAVIALAISSPYPQVTETTVVNEFTGILLSGLQ